MRAYRVRVPGRIPWRKFSHCLLEISVDQEYHEGPKFQETLRWAALNFKSAHIMLGDTVHRHNLMFQECLSEDESWRKCRESGDAWLIRNSDTIQSSAIPISISRWDDWLKDPRYSLARYQVGQIFEKHEDVREAVLRDGRRYIQSCLSQGMTNLDEEFAVKKCIDLILEENAGFSVMLEDHGPVDCYPGCELTSSELIRTKYIEEGLDGLKSRIFTRIKFKTINSSAKIRRVDGIVETENEYDEAI